MSSSFVSLRLIMMPTNVSADAILAGGAGPGADLKAALAQLVPNGPAARSPLAPSRLHMNETEEQFAVCSFVFHLLCVALSLREKSTCV